MSSTREDVIRRRHMLLRCADSSLNHELSKTASFISYLGACLDAFGVRPPYAKKETIMKQVARIYGFFLGLFIDHEYGDMFLRTIS
jgi:hypothetical protein